MSAVDGHDDRAVLEELGEADQLSVLVGHGEQRHWVADLRRALTGTRSLETTDKLIDGIGKAGPALANEVGNDPQPLAQRHVAVANLLKGLFQSVG